jgi:FAD/FMN-containing dehydrogenase
VTGRSSFEQSLSGDVIGPDDAGWSAARAAWNLAVDQHPTLVVVADGPKDVAATLGYAAEHGLRVAPQGTGHGASSLGALDETILLRTKRLGGVEVDSSARTARVGAGAVWDDVVGPAAKHGLAALHGFSGGVGVAGYTLGGGLGWLGRSRGLAANAVTGLDVVLADGRALRVDDQSEPELFWALRGGGGLGAVVTALELELFPLPEAYAGHIAWPLEQAPEVVDAYRSWTNDLPEELTSTIRLMRYPPAPELPPELRGQAFALVTLVFDGGADAGAQLVAALRGVGSPSADTLEPITGDQLPQISGDPPGPLAGIGNGMLMRELDAEAYLAVGGPEARTPLTNVEYRHLGGALARSGEGNGAAGAIDAEFLFYAVGSPAEPPSAADLTGALDEAQDQLAGSATGQSLATFAERQPGVDGLFSAETISRLAEVRRRYDPDGVIRSNHEVAA